MLARWVETEGYERLNRRDVRVSEILTALGCENDPSANTVLRTRMQASPSPQAKYKRHIHVKLHIINYWLFISYLSRDDVLAHSCGSDFAFPIFPRSTGTRHGEEIECRTNMVGIIRKDAVIIQLTVSRLLEQQEERQL